MLNVLHCLSSSLSQKLNFSTKFCLSLGGYGYTRLKARPDKALNLKSDHITSSSSLNIVVRKSSKDKTNQRPKWITGKFGVTIVIFIGAEPFSIRISINITQNCRIELHFTPAFIIQYYPQY